MCSTLKLEWRGEERRKNAETGPRMLRKGKGMRMFAAGVCMCVNALVVQTTGNVIALKIDKKKEKEK